MCKFGVKKILKTNGSFDALQLDMIAHGTSISSSNGYTVGVLLKRLAVFLRYVISDQTTLYFHGTYLLIVLLQKV